MIQDIRPGDRVLGENPIREDVDTGFVEPEPDSWRLVKLHMVKSDGHGLDVELLRPLDWLEQTAATDGGTIHLEIAELGIDGPATVLSIEPCPPIQSGSGHVVTGMFAHEPTDELLNVQIEGEPEPIGCTPNHPFWSETREEFVQAIELEPGEEVWTAGVGVTNVTSITPRPKSDRVYNLEVQGEHVYQVGESGVLVHNAGTEYFGGRRSFSSNSSIPKKSWTRIFGAKRGPKPKGTGQHNLTIESRIAKLKNRLGRDWEHVGGGSKKEMSIRTPGGAKSSRRPDISFRNKKTGEFYHENVGKTNAQGQPITREIEALKDLEDVLGIRPGYTAYD